MGLQKLAIGEEPVPKFFARPETFLSTLPSASRLRDGSNVSALQNRQFMGGQSFRGELHESFQVRLFPGQDLGDQPSVAVNDLSKEFG
jgi:hypothetical protein